MSSRTHKILGLLKEFSNKPSVPPQTFSSAGLNEEPRSTVAEIEKNASVNPAPILKPDVSLTLSRIIHEALANDVEAISDSNNVDIGQPNQNIDNNISTVSTSCTSSTGGIEISIPCTSGPGNMHNFICEDDFDDSDADPHYVEEESSSSSGYYNRVSDSGKKKTTKRVSKNKRDSEILHKRGREQQFQETVVKKRGRKPIKGETRHIRSLRRENRNLGREYQTRKGKVVHARICKEFTSCRLKCKDRIDEATRNSVFKQYWSLGNFNKRVAYIAALVTPAQKKTQKVKVQGEAKQKERLTGNYLYHVRINGEMRRVCKGCFLKTYGETNTFVTNVLKNKTSSVAGITHDDNRGKSQPANKTSEADLELVREHILALPSYESHYCRQQTSKKYLPAHYTLSKIYEEYKKFLPADKKAVCRKKYESIFHQMNMKIKAPSKDTCATCDKLNMRIKNSLNAEEQQNLKHELETHQSNAENAYEAKRKDKEVSSNDSSKLVYTFDLQQCLPTPDIQTSVAFYKRQLWTYDFTMHRCDDRQAFCFIWHEGIAGRGANQIASCLYKHLMTIPPEIKEITLYSDTCGGQNKNIFLPVMFTLVLKQKPTLECINHKFLVPGHTHMECDSDHSIIEKKKKKYHASIDHPRDWVQLIRTCGQKRPFAVKEMIREDFFEFSALLKTHFQHRKLDENGSKIVWRDIQWLRYTQDIGIVLMKTTLDTAAAFRKLNLRRRNAKISLTLMPSLSYKGPLPINSDKKRNLLDLLPYIDVNFHNFYSSLPTKEDIPNVLSDSSEEDVDE